MLNAIPDHWGPKFQFDGAAVTRTHTGPNSIGFDAPAHMALVLFTPQPRRQLALNSDRRTCGAAPAGALEIMPRQSRLYARWEVEKESLLVAFVPLRLRGLAGAEFDNADFDFRPPALGVIDEEAHWLARQMRYELENEALAGRERLDALLTLFGVHLLRRHSSLVPAATRIFAGGFRPKVWRRVEDFIDAHLHEHLSLERMAAEAGLSPSHFVRAFRQTTGQTPHLYITEMRLNRARNMIEQSSTSLAQVARSLGFSSHSHMTALIRRHWGVTPSELRREAGRGREPDPPPADGRLAGKTAGF